MIRSTVPVLLGALLAASATFAQAAEFLVDNSASTFALTGTWSTTATGGYNNTSYVYGTTGVNRTAKWSTQLPAAGKYRVEVIFRSGTNRPTAAAYTIADYNSTFTATADQTINNLTWVSLGTFQLDPGTASVTLNAQTSTPTGRSAIADAVRFVEVLDPAEMRTAIITVYDTLNTTTAIQNYVDVISSQNYNSIAVHARFRGDATYFPNKTNSTYPNNEPRSTAAGSIDVLQEFITRGQAKGMKVFAYTNLYCMTDGKDTDARANHPINTHPEWITYAYNGGNPVRMTTANDEEGLWFDPAIPEMREYTANVIADIVKNYNVDGVMLDRIRYPQTNFSRTVDFGYHPTAIANFNAQYGKSGVPSPTDIDWQNFRREQINLGIENVYYHVINEKPDCIVLSYPIGRLNDAVNFNYCKWADWMNNGYMDVTFPQIYRDTNADFTTGCNEHLAAYSGPRLFGVALKAYSTAVDLDGQIGITRTKGFDGTSPFRHGSLMSIGLAPELQLAYTGRAPWPAMPYKTQGTATTATVDNGSGSPIYITSGTWTTTATGGFNNGSYQYATVGANSFATWDLDVPSTGRWKVEAMYRNGANRATAAKYDITAANGKTTRTINQQLNNLVWVDLGTHEFVMGRGLVTLNAKNSSGGSVVIADAIRITKQ
ncbi:MAG: family 10 glycosylhydrolase [Candidatus Sumerlaeia bacterium]|nr:family 10 glycosylhydrolase [Candidatus Sumerlaeia bacterium]